MVIQNIRIPSGSEDKFERLYNLLVSENQKYNLTAITQREDVYLKHFLDSLACASLIEQGARGIDIGTGAGFPALPLLIARQDISLTALDSVAKKLGFVRLALAELDLRCEVVHARCEDYARQNPEAFDFALSRAVAPLPVLLEYALPMLRVGGSLFAYKTDDKELAESKTALNLLGGGRADVYTVQLSDLSRTIIKITKTAPTPKQYPRPQNKPRLKPL